MGPPLLCFPDGPVGVSGVLTWGPAVVRICILGSGQGSE